MGRALYRKYRSKNLGEVVGQPHVTTTLANSLKNGKIRHAYLLSGPRGVGKTSVARIIAHEVNNLPYDDETNHLDIIEVDAASNRRIDEIRELRERVRLAPTSLKYKVYIIDEVHMLTREAYNALLKTLEEPPEHVIFILATTETHKLPETIISRCLRFTFKPIEKDDIKDHLKMIATSEKIKITDEALDLIAAHGGGSFRDSINLLDQASGLADKVELTDVTSMLGVASDAVLAVLLDNLTKGTPAELLKTLQDLKDQGISPSSLAKQISNELRTQVIDGQLMMPIEKLTKLMEQLLTVPASTQPFAYLEISLLEAQLNDSSVIPEVIEEKLEEIEQIAIEAKEEAEAKPAAPKKSKSTAKNFGLEEIWPKVLEQVKKNHNTLYSVVRMASPMAEDGELTLWFDFAFHQKRLDEPRHKRLIADVLKELSGQDYVITCALRGTLTEKQAEKDQPSEKTDQLQAISNIFGDAEMLES